MGKEHRVTVPAEVVQAMKPAYGWDDGRQGFEWCRFDALVTQDGLRAEVTWDDGQDGDNRDAREYYDPQLLLETNRRVDGEWQTVDSVVIQLDQDQAEIIVRSPPSRLLVFYYREIKRLRRE